MTRRGLPHRDQKRLFVERVLCVLVVGLCPLMNYRELFKGFTKFLFEVIDAIDAPCAPFVYCRPSCSTTYSSNSVQLYAVESKSVVRRPYNLWAVQKSVDLQPYVLSPHGYRW